MRHAFRVTLALLAMAGPARLGAQSVPSPYRYLETKQTIGIHLGAVSTDRGERNLGPESAPLIGARYHYRFAGPVALEVGASFAPSTRTVYTRTSATADSVRLEALGEADALLFLVEGGLRFNVTGPRTWNGLAPYVAATGGLVSNLSGASALEEALEADRRFDFGPGFALGVAAGTDWFLTERLSVRLEARDYLWRLTAPAGFSISGREESEWTNNLGITLGAALHF